MQQTLRRAILSFRRTSTIADHVHNATLRPLRGFQPWSLGTTLSGTRRACDMKHSAIAGVLCAFALCASVAPAAAQPFPVDIGPLTTTLDRRALRDLPSTGNLFSLLETTQPEIVSDRFSGSVNLAEPARLGVFVTSWTQTTFLVDGVDITSAERGGPLVVPPALAWQSVGVTSGMFPVDVSGPGLLIAVEPLRPPSSWQMSAEGTGSGARLVGGSGRLAAPIAQPAGLTTASVSAGGPIAGGRAGLLVSASMTRASQFDRGGVSTSQQVADSIVSHLVVTPSSTDEVRTLGWRQVTEYPGAHGIPAAADGSSRREVSSHLQSTWQRDSPTGGTWRVFGSATQRSWDLRSSAPGLQVIERLADGPPSSLAAPGGGRERRWSIGWRANGAAARLPGGQHALQFGADANGVSSRTDAAPAVRVGELVGGIPARLWAFSASGETRRTRVGVAAFVSDTVRLWDAVTVQGGLRVDRVSGEAHGAPQGITWTTVLPRVSARWQFGWAALYAAGSRTADSLLTDVLAYGDPAGTVGDVHRWDGGREGPLVARVGPGSGAFGGLTAIDPAIERPTSRELIAGIEVAPPWFMRVRFTAISRRGSNQLGLLNVGVPGSSYDIIRILDLDQNRANPVRDQLLPVYNRAEDTFGMDRYVLSNSGQQPTKFGGATLILDRSTPRVYLAASGVMGWSFASAGNRGFGPAENDGGIIGELSADPNAATNARGNVFADRQYLFRVATAYRLPYDVSFGVVARYQDGQPFSRMVVVPGLNQGADAVRAFRGGNSRFTFTGTLDLRVQKGVVLPGGGRGVLVIDGFNVINMDKEVEEWVATGPDYRTPTAAQPPRAVHIGLRVEF